MKKILLINLLIFTTSCSYISGPEGMFPPTKDAFFKEKVEEDILLPDDLNYQKQRKSLSSVENLQVI